jgi:hypothetical protein
MFSHEYAKSQAARLPGPGAVDCQAQLPNLANCPESLTTVPYLRSDLLDGFACHINTRVSLSLLCPEFGLMAPTGPVGTTRFFRGANLSMSPTKQLGMARLTLGMRLPQIPA